MKLLSASSISAWMALITSTRAVRIYMHAAHDCQGYSQACVAHEDFCCTQRPFQHHTTLYNDRRLGASSRFDGLPPTAVGFVYQTEGLCRSQPVNIGFGVTFCLNSVPSVYEPHQHNLITAANWEFLTKTCETSKEACDGWDVKTGLKNGVDMGEMQRLGTIPINLFSRDSYNEVDENKRGCQVADELTFANGHRFNISPKAMADEDYELLVLHAEADSNMEDVPKHLYKYEIDHEGVLARRQLTRRRMKDPAERLVDHYARNL
jgi:hypothetical protein